MHLNLDRDNPESGYEYDAKQAERPLKFITEFCWNYDGRRFAGKPWKLFDFQRQWIEDIYGWKSLDTGYRRFSEVFFEAAKGCGKSPLLALIGMFEFFRSDAAGGSVISAAKDYKQARVTFDCAKGIIYSSPRFSEMIEAGALVVKEREIIYKPTRSKWEIVSGKVEGKAGFRPTCVLLDELWEQPNSRFYQALIDNVTKQPDALMVCATNSGSRKDTICWQQHERAVNVLSGASKDETYYPIVFNTPEDADPASEETWRKANPALDLITPTANLRDKWIKVKENPMLEPEFRRLFCGQWVLGGAEKLIDMQQWGAATRAFTRDEIRDIAELPCVMGLDMSLTDDLTSLLQVWIADERLYVRSKFWLPRATALSAEEKLGIPYTKWQRNRDIELVGSETVDPQVQEAIAKYVIRFSRQHNLRALCYDPSRAGLIVNRVMDAGINTLNIPQGYYLSPAIEEIIRQLKAQTMVIAPNGVMDFCAQNVEGERGKYGDALRLRKDGNAGKYKGSNRAYKIDGIQALATAMHQVRLELAQPSDSWSGNVWIV